MDESDWQKEPNRVSFWWMNDNHTYVRLEGNDLCKIMANATRCYKKDKYGMLCPVRLFRDEKELYQVGQPVHGNGEPEQLKQWIKDVSSDPYIKKLLKEGKNI
jgi:hypothetical protein